MCGWCGREVHMTQLAKVPQVVRSWNNYVSDAAYRCDNCKRYSVVSWYSSYDPSSSHRSGEPESYDGGVSWSPPPVKRPEYPDVPPHIADAAREAWLCYGHDANVAACAVARSVIEAAAKKHEITVRGIESKIDALKDKNLIWGDLIESAHLVRQFGNDAAHGDVIKPATSDEARDVLDIMDELLHQLFTSPARSKRLAEGRTARKSITD